MIRNNEWINLNCTKHFPWCFLFIMQYILRHLSFWFTSLKNRRLQLVIGRMIFFIHVRKASFAASHWLELICVRNSTIWLFGEYVNNKFWFLTCNGRLFCCPAQLEAVDGCGIVFPVSIWMRKLNWEDKPRCIAVMEPVERKSAVVTFDSEVLCHHNSHHTSYVNSCVNSAFSERLFWTSGYVHAFLINLSRKKKHPRNTRVFGEFCRVWKAKFIPQPSHSA